jgi:GntR family transcriptional regulator, carbon starvation induced regulator
MATRVSESGPSLRSSIAESVRDDILSGRLVPGTRINTTDLQARFDASLGAVREALLQLGTDGLAISLDRRGFHVASVSVADLEDLATTRVAIETFLIREAIANANAASEGDILAALHRLQNAPHEPDGTSGAAWYDEHRRFHAALIGASTSQWMGRFRSTLHDQFERYCRISMAVRRSTHAKLRHSHKALADAVLAHDAARACELMSDHVWHTVRLVLSTSSTFPIPAERRNDQ